jgi:tetratricopeptide (TPR) repeat protein
MFSRLTFDAARSLSRRRFLQLTALSAAGLRRIKGAIEAMQKADGQMAQKTYAEAEASLGSALKQAPEDYAALVMMAKCQTALRRPAEALRYAEHAKRIYPAEAQALHLAGFAKIQQKHFDGALADFSAYERLLPGNPNTSFFEGLALEGMQRGPDAARAYARYIQSGGQGDRAQYAYGRLVQWGYVKK